MRNVLPIAAHSNDRGPGPAALRLVAVVAATLLLAGLAPTAPAAASDAVGEQAPAGDPGTATLQPLVPLVS